MKLQTLSIAAAVSSALFITACSDDDQQASTGGGVTISTPTSSNPELLNTWFNQGQQQVDAAAAAWEADMAATRSTSQGKAKNVILFVGDGMGMSTVTAARILEGQMSNPNGGEEHKLSFEHFPFTALSKTYNTDAQTPDSAGTMTAMVTGAKSFKGSIAIAGDAERGDCASAQGKELVTALDLAKQAGMSAGVVSTARITHATPAATYAKVPDRDWEHDTDDQTGCTDIATQLVNYNIGGGLDVVLGGGLREFTLSEDGGKRSDTDLTATWQANNPNGKFVTNRDGFLALDTTNTSKLLGLFSSSHMDYEADRMKFGEDSQPSLAEMTAAAVEVLAANEQGFFLMVEAGRIDHAHHGGNAHRSLKDTLALSDAVAVADQLTNDEDTLIIVTADHSHVFTIAGYPRRGNPILGLVENKDMTLATANDGKPYTTVGYANGPGNIKNYVDASYPYDSSASFDNGERVDLTSVDVSAKDFMQQATVPLSSETHAGEDVPVYAKGPGASLVRGTMEQNVIFHIMNFAGDLVNRSAE